MLFVTNYLAILLTGVLMFSIMGYPAAYHAERSRRAKVTAIGIAVGPRAPDRAAARLHQPAVHLHQLRPEPVDGRRHAWLDGSDYRLSSVEVQNGEVSVVVAGQGQLPPQRQLQDALRGRLFGMPVTLEVVPTTTSVFETTGPR